jgi:hypothetical protein
MSLEDDDLGYVPRPAGLGMADPAALAIASLVVGTLSLGGFGLLNGANYILPLTQGMSSTARTVLAGLLGAAIAVVAVVLGSVAGRRTHPGDPGWVARLAQAGVLIGTITFVLRLIATAVSAAQVADSGYFAPL